MSLDVSSEPSILVVDDNPADVRLIREAVAERKIHIAEDAWAALAFLRTHIPHLVLLDISLPQMNGHELLSEIRAQARLEQVPIVVFSSSDSPEDIRRAYSGSANCYVTKPADLDQFLDTVRRIDRFWLATR